MVEWNVKSQRACNNQKILLVDYTRCVEIEGYLFMNRVPRSEDGFLMFYAT